MAEIPTWCCVVAGALARSDGRWLMHRRPDGKHHGGLWEFPGGKVEPGEMPADALVRELAEELGIACDRDDLMPAAFAEERPASGGSPIVILLYTCTRWTGQPCALEPGSRIEWLTPEEMAHLEKPPLDRLLHRALMQNTQGKKAPS